MIYTYWKGTILSKWDETHTETQLLKIGSDLLLTGMKDGVTIPKQIAGYRRFLDGMKKRKDEKKSIRRTDHNMRNIYSGTETLSRLLNLIMGHLRCHTVTSHVRP